MTSHPRLLVRVLLCLGLAGLLALAVPLPVLTSISRCVPVCTDAGQIQTATAANTSSTEVLQALFESTSTAPATYTFSETPHASSLLESAASYAVTHEIFASTSNSATSAVTSLVSAPAGSLSPLHVVGNALVDEFGNNVVLKGVDITDQDQTGFGPAVGRALNQNDFQYLAQAWKVRAVRIPVLPALWPSEGDNLTLLRQDVYWANEYGMYAIIDWHAFGNIAIGNVTNGTPGLVATEAFWSEVSQYFSGNPGVLYEIFNEPADISWYQWEPLAQTIVNVIRQNDPSTVILVSGVDWSYDLSSVLIEPISGRNIGYVVHPYPHGCGGTASCWPILFGITARFFPVFATEWGYYTPDQTQCTNSTTPYRGNWQGYNIQLLSYLQSLGISWTAFVWDPVWCPAMLLSFTNYQPSQFGKFVEDALASNASPSLVSNSLTLSLISTSLGGIDVALVLLYIRNSFRFALSCQSRCFWATRVNPRSRLPGRVSASNCATVNGKWESARAG